MAKQQQKSGASRMGMKKKGTTGAAKNYITRNQALKKLQVTLADFRRLCILKGIYPREPRNKKKANRGSTAPTTFYYFKDIAYLQHEPILQKLREHKAFAKKLSRALGRGQQGLARNLEERHEGYRLDHIIKERYPTFADSLRDLDDALSLIVLFATLPASAQVSSAVIANCARLAAEWQLYVMRTQSLRKVFLSVKGIYFQAEISGQKVTWLVPYAFTQRVRLLRTNLHNMLTMKDDQIPPDVDFRIMLTFLELYQTLLGFVFFKLFTDQNLVYPLKLDTIKDEAGAGIGALLLQESRSSLTSGMTADQPTLPADDSARPKAKDVRRQIREMASGQADVLQGAVGTEMDPPDEARDEAVDDDASALFSPYIFFLSREVTRPTLEFVIRSFGGRVGWDAVLGAGSPFAEDDARITHHVVDRPVAVGYYAHPGKRAYVQPQWVVDSVNLGRLLPTDEYAPGQTLPPHLSPFAEGEASTRYAPEVGPSNPAANEEVQEGEGVDELEKGFEHAAEIVAEEQGMAHAQFQAEQAAMREPRSPASPRPTKKNADELAEIMLSGKQKKIYSKVARAHDRKLEERAKLQAKKQKLEKRAK